MMTRIIFCGCGGRMGHMIYDLLKEDSDAKIVEGVDKYKEAFADFKVVKDISLVTEEADVIIDFSAPDALHDVLSYAKDKGLSVVLCTTGYSAEDVEFIKEASKEVAILRSANMSLGINLLMKFLKENAGLLLNEGYDAEIVEKHHRLKKDAPSGTALALAEAINASVDNEYEFVFDRSERREERPKKEIGISAVRGGTIVGEHEIIFAGTDEVIEIRHGAYSKAVFGKGAITAAKFMKGKKSGLYDMKDVVL